MVPATLPAMAVAVTDFIRGSVTHIMNGDIKGQGLSRQGMIGIHVHVELAYLDDHAVTGAC